MRSSRISGFYKLVQDDRLGVLVEAGFVAPEAAELLRGTGSVLTLATADKMVENVVGIFELPIGLGLNFLVNGRDYVVPMVVEEPSVVAAVSHAAAIVRKGGGFVAEADPPVGTAQIQVVDLPDFDRARDALDAAKQELVGRANEIEPNMARRGGGAIGIEVREVGGPRAGVGGRDLPRMLVLHVHVDCCDAMGANLINTIAEGLAPDVEAITGGRVHLRILSNLSDRRRVRARCTIPAGLLDWQGYSGEAVADGIVLASDFAEADPWRAATHNKGVMNGIDAAAIAVGQDWRAIEAGAHAWAARDGQYRPLARWSRSGAGDLVGEIDLPLAVGIVGGPIRLHPTVGALLRTLGVQTAGELACVLGSVGLAQNLAAIKALASTGIQRGHMALHARSVAATAGAEGERVEEVARLLVECGDVKVERARLILSELRARGT